MIDVRGPLDARALDFITDSITAGADAGQVMSVVQLNSRAVLDSEAYERLVEQIARPPLPVAVWVGPAPAVAYGGVALLPGLASHAAVAPGSDIGKVEPLVLGEDVDVPERDASPGDDLSPQPSIRQYLQALDGASFETAAGTQVVSTVRPFDDGVTLLPVTFRKPGLWARFLRLAVTPEAAFFFMMVGLTLVVFEFYALGPGVAAAVAGISVFLGGWGLLTLPTRWWALLLAGAGLLFLVSSHQRGSLIRLTAVGALLLQLGGMYLVDGEGQLDPRWWLVLPTVLGVLFFFTMAMPTVQRARLSTETIGRDGLIGGTGTALVDFGPDGLVEVGGARWRATAHRESGISEGDRVEVVGVDGLFLEVEPPSADRET